jgi:hypothetical protein
MIERRAFLIQRRSNAPGRSVGKPAWAGAGNSSAAVAAFCRPCIGNENTSIPRRQGFFPRPLRYECARALLVVDAVRFFGESFADLSCSRECRAIRIQFAALGRRRPDGAWTAPTTD